ncbi:MAG TPA: ATP-grasp domain-containing protein, partial [Chlamydiales bacterium]|nr:ATP-grasp domain-containing protein [Chlamydiales bacterium]
TNGEQSVEAAAMLREHYGLPTTRCGTFSDIINKFKLRKTLKESGLSSLSHFHGQEVDKWDRWHLNGPGYFKPVRGTGSLFVARCGNLEDLRRAKEDWTKSAGRLPKLYDNYLHSSSDYHLEEEIDGKLFSVEGISVNGDYRCLGIVSTIVFSEDPIIEMGSCFPFAHPLSDSIIELVKNAHRALRITEGPTHTEVIVKDERIEIIDLNPRFIGADVMYSINHALGIRVEEILTDWIIGKPLSKFNTVPKQYSCLQYIMPPHEVDFIKSLEFPKDESIVFRLKLVPESKKMVSDPSQIDVIGVYLTVGNSFEEAIENSKSFQEKILINKTFKGRY